MHTIITLISILAIIILISVLTTQHNVNSPIVVPKVPRHAAEIRWTPAPRPPPVPDSVPVAWKLKRKSNLISHHLTLYFYQNSIMDDNTPPFNKAPGSNPGAPTRTSTSFRPPYAEEDYGLGKEGYGSGFSLEDLLNSEAHVESVRNVGDDSVPTDGDRKPPAVGTAKNPVEEAERLGKEEEDKEEEKWMQKFSNVVAVAAAKAVELALKAHGVL